MKKPAVFIDRDGTVNEEMGYINHLSRFVLLPGTAEAIRLLNRNGALAIVVSNQSGIARGYFPLELLDKVHELMHRSLGKEGAAIDGVFVCPHYPSEPVQGGSGECDCRKPKTGLIRQACEHFEIDLERSYVVGDRFSDIKMACRLGLKGILVKTGYGLGEMEYVLPRVDYRPAYIAENLLEAVRWIIEQEKREHCER